MTTGVGWRARALRLAAGLLCGIGLWSGPAHARDLRYCLAIDPADRTAFFSRVFETAAALDAIEKAFGRALDEDGQKHGAPSCPRSDDRAAAERDRTRAMTYNQTLGRHPVEFDWRY